MASIHLENLSLHYPIGPGVNVRGTREDDPHGMAGRIVKNARGFAAIQAIDAISLRLEDGDWLGIIGSNGSGKTTLLQLMAGILPPVAGHIQVEGRVTTMLSLGLGMLGEATGLENIYLSGLVAGATRKQIKMAVEDVAEFTQLGDYLKMPMRTYSHGMAMRLKFACATAFQPDIILLDEWIGAGDAEFQEKARLRMESLLAGVGIVVIASHNRQLIRRVSTKMLWLERGRVQGFGEPDEIIEMRMASEKAALAEHMASGG